MVFFVHSTCRGLPWCLLLATFYSIVVILIWPTVGFSVWETLKGQRCSGESVHTGVGVGVTAGAAINVCTLLSMWFCQCVQCTHDKKAVISCSACVSGCMRVFVVVLPLVSAGWNSLTVFFITSCSHSSLNTHHCCCCIDSYCIGNATTAVMHCSYLEWTKV